MKGQDIYSTLAFGKAFRVALCVAAAVHLALFCNPFFRKGEERPRSADVPVLHAARIVLSPPPEPPKVVKKIVRAKIVPKVVETPVEEEMPEPIPEQEPVALSIGEALAVVAEAPPPKVAPAPVEEPKPSADSVKKVMRSYLGALKRQLEKGKAYPATARRLKQEGTVRVRFTILDDGSLENIEIAESSRYSSLDNSAKEAVERMARFEPIPEILNKKSWRIEIPVKYKLNNGRTP